jgi:hypothetical protein
MKTNIGATALACMLSWVLLVAACGGDSPGIPDIETTPELTEPGVVQLQGSVHDDTLPHGPLNIWWSQVSGPGPVHFADITRVDTTATFTIPGVYVLRLTASDGEFIVTDDVTITVLP